MVLLFCEPGCKLRVLRGPGARGGQNHGGRQGAHHGRWVAACDVILGRKSITKIFFIHDRNDAKIEEL